MNDDTEMYILKINFKILPILGIVNYKFKKEVYYINKYNNGNEYLGYYNNDLRKNKGIEEISPKPVLQKFISRQYYFG